MNDSEQDDNDKEEERDVKENAVHFVIVTVGRFDLVTDTTTGSNTLAFEEHENENNIDRHRGNKCYLVNVEDETGQHVVTLFIDVVILLLDIELSEKVEGDDRVDVDDDGQEHDSQHKLLAVVSN